MIELSIIIKSFFAWLIAFLITFYLVPIFLTIAFKLNILDMPDGKVKVHKQPTPYLGGVAIYVGFITALALTLPFENKITLFIIGSTLLLFIGLIDDLVRMKPAQKFLGQMIATLCFLKGGLHLKENFFLNNYWNIPISYFWILSVVNAFNLVDIMDGLATSLAMYCTISFIVIACILGQSNVLILLMAFLGTLIAFLWYNYPPAKIYLGDAGSLFIGGFLAIIPFLFNWGTYNWYGFLTPIVILGLPLLEVCSLIVIRMYKGIPFYNGSPDHFALYLQKNGWTPRVILLYLGFISLILLLVSLALIFNVFSMTSLLIIFVLFLILWFVVLMDYQKSLLGSILFFRKG